MKRARGFASDNAAGVHPRVLEAIAEANADHALAYGADAWTQRAEDALRSAFDADAEVLLTFGGTGANVVGLATVMRGWDAVLCAGSAHLENDECAAAERFIGGKLVAVEHDYGRVTPETLAAHVGPTRGVHHARPRVVSITQPTEWGTLYTLGEMRALADFAHDHGLLLHVDGARLANAAAALGAELADLGARAGVDVLSFGGTKNGLLGAEAVLIFDRALAADAAYARKQAMQLASKMRFLAAQFLAILEDGLWRRLAARANACAARLAGGVRDLPCVEIVCDSPCNMVFPRLPAPAMALGETFGFYTWDHARSIARWVTAFDTTDDDVDALVRAVTDAVG